VGAGKFVFDDQFARRHSWVVQEAMCTTDPCGWRWPVLAGSRRMACRHARQGRRLLRSVETSGQHMQAEGRGNPRRVAITVCSTNGLKVRAGTAVEREFADCGLVCADCAARCCDHHPIGPYQWTDLIGNFLAVDRIFLRRATWVYPFEGSGWAARACRAASGVLA